MTAETEGWQVEAGRAHAKRSVSALARYVDAEALTRIVHGDVRELDRAGAGVRGLEMPRARATERNAEAKERLQRWREGSVSKHSIEWEIARL